MTDQAQWEEALAKSRIPSYMHEGISRWLTDGITPGRFLTAVLSNDLRGAFEHADDQNGKLVRDYIAFLYNHAPIGSWGSEHYFRTWAEDHFKRRGKLEEASR